MEQSFCGNCGSTLSFGEFIAQRVQTEVSKAVKDRDVLETESSIKVFERAWGWMKLIGGAAGILIAIGASIFAWNLHDLRSAVDSGKATVSQSASNARSEIATISANSLGDIQQAAKSATETSQKTNLNVARLSGDLEKTVSKTKAELAEEAASVKG